jgi:hypothetical protein
MQTHMDARFTSEWSILVSPPNPTEAPAGAQLACAYLGLAAIIVFWDYGGALGASLLAIGILLLASAVIFNAISVSRNESAYVERFHSIGIINTLIGKTIETGWLRAVVVVVNALLVLTAASAFVIGDQLDAAWGCYSGHLPLSRLTNVPCTINPRPERCWDVTTGRGNAVSCTGERHASVQSAEWVPLAILMVEWAMVALLRYKGALSKKDK